jgi:hypothetical protein
MITAIGNIESGDGVITFDVWSDSPVSETISAEFGGRRLSTLVEGGPGRITAGIEHTEDGPYTVVLQTETSGVTVSVDLVLYFKQPGSKERFCTKCGHTKRDCIC